MKDYIQSHIDSITPYYFVINNEFKVVEAGKTVLFSHPILIGKEFQYTFFLEDIEYEGVTLENLIRLSGIKLTIRSKSIKEFKLEGQFYHIAKPNKYLYFIGSPDLTTYLYLSNKGMPITHYWHFIDIPDIIPIFKQRVTMIDSFFKMNNTIEKQQRELELEKLKHVEVLDSIDQIIFQVDVNGKFTFLNKIWEKVMGYTLEETLGIPFFNFMQPEELSESHKTFKALINKEIAVNNVRRKYITKTGEVIWMRVHANQIKNESGEVLGTVGTLQNISIDVKNEQKLELITSNVLDEITMFDTEGNYYFASPSAYINRGFGSYEEMKATNAFELIDDNLRNVGLQTIRENGYINWEGQYKFADGSIRWYQVASRIIYDELINKELIIAVSRNIEDRKKSELQIEMALEKEMELNQLRSDFISTTSHEFKTPLVVIKSNIESLLRSDAVKLGKNIHPEIQKHLMSIDSEADRLVSLITDTLLLEKAQNNLLNPSLEPIDIVFLIINTAQRHNSYNTQNNILINAKVIPPNINIDLKLMEYVFDNLITNALKYSKGKSIPEINIYHDDLYVKVIIKDNGIGIPFDDLSKLFTPFFRASNTRGISGTGMGLCIVKKILDVHNSNIEIVSELNKGTIVKVEIPYGL